MEPRNRERCITGTRVAKAFAETLVHEDGDVAKEDGPQELHPEVFNQQAQDGRTESVTSVGRESCEARTQARTEAQSQIAPLNQLLSQ